MFEKMLDNVVTLCDSARTILTDVTGSSTFAVGLVGYIGWIIRTKLKNRV